GDFTLHTDAWLGIEPLLRKSGLQLLCASERQGRLVSRFLRAPAKTLAICPFPTDASLFAPDAAAGARWRKRLGIAASDFLICYSGRLSLQKNVLRLIREFVLLRKWGKIPVHLVLAGPFDDLGAPMFGIETPRYFYFQQFEALLAGLDPDDRAAVHYVGNLESGELRALYNAADCYASLSLHHDEDYGMAPAEALLCGTPVLLTDWGGYASFGGYAVPVVLGKKGLRVKSAHVQRGFLEMWMRRPSRESRRALSLEFGNRISIPAVARRLRELLGQPIARFQGFAPLMKQLSRASVFCEGAPFQSGAGKGALYERIYEAYLTGSRF
ncbi:MAG: glycosyltransferase family 4 protein, partial [Bdellovibrionota bacterium]